jgi:tetratricopeptide (TPR) repeat protein
MRHTLVFAIMFLIPASVVLADFTDVVTQADSLHEQGKFAEARALLLDAVASLPDGKEQAELYWRVSRETIELGDIAEKAKKPQDEVLSYFVEGEGYADKAIAADPGNDLGYFWKSANIGRWGQVKGVFNALGKATDIRDLLLKVLSINPDRSDAYFVLGQLYRELPGWPISFGNTDWAVSLGRKAVDLNTAEVAAGKEKDNGFDFKTELAKTLHQRNWTSSARQQEQHGKAEKYAAARSTFEKACYYEGSLELKDVSDAQEAREIVRQVVDSMEALPSLTAGQVKDLRKAKDLLAVW